MSRSSIFNFSDTGRTLLTMLVMSLAIEACVAKAMPYVDGNAAVMQKLLRTERESVGATVLVLGDSRAHQGVIPRAVEHALNAEGGSDRVLNLAVPGMQTPFTYFILKRYCENNPPPRVVLVNFSYYLLGGRQWMEDIYFSHYTPTIGEASEAIDTRLVQPLEGWRWWVRTRIPSARFRKQVHRLARQVTDLGELSRVIRSNVTVIETNKDPYDGYLDRGNKGLAEGQQFGFANSKTLHEGYSVYFEYMRKFMGLSEQYGFEIVVFRFPWPEWYASNDEWRDVYGYYQALIEKEAARFPRVHYVRNEMFFTSDEFVDPLHLNSYGSLRLSRSLGEIVARLDDVDSGGSLELAPPPPPVGVKLSMISADGDIKMSWKPPFDGFDSFRVLRKFGEPLQGIADPDAELVLESKGSGYSGRLPARTGEYYFGVFSVAKDGSPSRLVERRIRRGGERLEEVHLNVDSLEGPVGTTVTLAAVPVGGKRWEFIFYRFDDGWKNLTSWQTKPSATVKLARGTNTVLVKARELGAQAAVNSEKIVLVGR